MPGGNGNPCPDIPLGPARGPLGMTRGAVGIRLIVIPALFPFESKPGTAVSSSSLSKVIMSSSAMFSTPIVNFFNEQMQFQIFILNILTKICLRLFYFLLPFADSDRLGIDIQKIAKISQI